VGGAGTRPVPGRDRLVDHAARQPRRARLLRRLVRVRLPRLLLLVGACGGPLLRQRVDLLHLLIRLDHRLLPGGAVGDPALDDLQLVGLERERREIAAAHQIPDGVERLLVVALERLRGSGERDEQSESENRTHEEPFSREARTLRYFSISWVTAISSLPAFSFCGSTRIPPTRMVPPRWMA